MTVSEEEFQALLEKFKSKEWRMGHLYWIKDKDGKRIKFKRNEGQLAYSANAHTRNINLKARQIGFTTDACIDALDDCLFNDYFDAGIIADDLDNAKSIFTNKVKFAYDNLPDAIKLARPASTDREGELRFSNGSSISVSTSFRGGTLRRLHVSELAKIAVKWPQKAREIITGAFEAVGKDGRIDVESTAEGMTGAFYDLCQMAMEIQASGRALSPLEFKFHFNPWWKASEYRDNPEREIPPKFATYFAYLENNHGIILDPEQKAWYVAKAATLKGDIKREYPSYPEEAFMHSGRPVFDPEQVAADIARAEKLSFRTGKIDHAGRFQLDPYGPIKIFKEHVSGCKYAIGADVAEGLESGDFSAMSVINRDWQQVASYCNHIHPDLFGADMIGMGKLYNEALLAPEVNNHGLTTLTHITKANYRFLYMRQVLDERTNQYTAKAGWQTNVKTKPMMLDEFIAAYRDKHCQVNDVETLREMLSLAYEPDGSANLNGKDRVVSFCIAIQAAKQLPAQNIGTYQEGSEKTRFKTLEEMLRHSVEKEESYFDSV